MQLRKKILQCLAPAGDCKGYTMVELLIFIVILGALAAIAVPNYLLYREKALVVAAISELRIIDEAIAVYHSDNGFLPESLSVLRTEYIDPWGRPYQYLNIQDAEKGKKGGGPTKGKPRKDHFLVPVNSDYDLYSVGSDGESVAPFTASKSQDDVVRANNGAFYGLAEDF